MAAPLVPNWKAKARAAAKRYGLDPNIFVRQINAESGGRNYGANHAGARGIAQFIPSTARSMGIDPMNPDQALDGAARLMARYVRQYGSYEKALRAYNAGPGAIEKSRGYRETNAYVAKILNGRDPGKLGKASKGGGSTRTTSSTRTTKTSVPFLTEKFDQEGYEKARKQASLKSFLQQSGGGKNWKMLASLLPDTVDPAQFTSQQVEFADQSTTTTSTSRTRTSKGGGGGSKKSGGVLPGLKGRGGTLKELFYDPIGGFKNQKSIGAIGGHSNHVHVAGSGPKATRALGQLAQSMGLTVRENSYWDKVDPVHTTNSNHYRFGGRGAIDVSGDPKKMAAFTRKVMQIYGLK